MCYNLKLSLFGDDSPGGSGGGLMSKFFKAKAFFKRKTNKQGEDVEAEFKKETSKHETPLKTKISNFKSGISNFFQKKKKNDTLPYTKGENVEMSGVVNPAFKEPKTVAETVQPQVEVEIVQEPVLTPVQQSANNLNKAISSGGEIFLNLFSKIVI